MCGIAGYFGSKPLEQARIDQCLALMGRRGPDAKGTYVNSHSNGNHVCLLHTRLNIIDPDSRSDQPYRVGNSILSYNGELYNYLEVRAMLERSGTAFGTTGDTEVLAQALVQWGVAGLDRLEGMWAFARYDENTGSLLLCRDRFGEKPLYIHSSRHGFFFGSEIKFLFALMGHQLKINTNHLCRNLVNGYKSIHKTPEQYFEDLDTLKPGTWTRLDTPSRLTTEKYWHARHRPEEEMPYSEAVSKTRDALIKAVDIRLRADVPLAFCMSGGVDSNSLISIARRVFDYDVHGFTIVNQDERYEEQSIVDAAVHELGIKHTEIPADTSRFLEQLRTLVIAHDGPVCTITYYAQWLLLQAISKAGYRVSVSGTGADELFTGYFDHHLFYLGTIHADARRYEEAVNEWKEYILPLVRNPFLRDPAAFVKCPTARDHIYLNADEFSECLVEPWEELFHEEAYCSDLLRNRMMNELFHEAVPPILHEDDLNAMYFSVENRSPFLDRDLYETAFSIPTRHLVRRGFAKAVLRDAMKGIVPDAVLDSHRKVGFNAPVFDYLDIQDPDVRAESLSDSPVFDIVRRDRVEALFNKGVLPNSESKFVFNFLCAKMFMEEFSA